MAAKLNRRVMLAGLSALLVAGSVSTYALAESKPKPKTLDPLAKSDPKPKPKLEAGQRYLLQAPDGSIYQLSQADLTQIAIIGKGDCKYKCLSVSVGQSNLTIPTDRLSGYRLPAKAAADVKTQLRQLGSPAALNGAIVLEAGNFSQ